MGLLCIFDDHHPSFGGRRSPRGRLRSMYTAKQLEDIYFTENWLIKFADKITEKTLKTKHDTIVKLDEDTMKLKSVVDDLEVEVSFVK